MPGPSSATVKRMKAPLEVAAMRITPRARSWCLMALSIKFMKTRRSGRAQVVSTGMGPTISVENPARCAALSEISLNRIPTSTVVSSGATRPTREYSSRSTSKVSMRRARPLSSMR